MSSNVIPDIVKEGSVTVISLGADFENLDEWGHDSLGTAMLEAVDDADPPLVAIDLSQVKFFGSSFIEILFRVWNRLNSREGGQFGICGLTTYCKEILEVTHLDRLWTLYESKDDAINSMSGN